MRLDTLTVLRKWPGQSNVRNWALQIDDRLLPASARQLAIFECLHENLGMVVSYARLCSILGLLSDRGKDRHLLRQYIKLNNDMLEANKLPYVIAVVNDAGYALCRISERPAPTVDRYQNAGIDLGDTFQPTHDDCVAPISFPI
jgi:DNA-binding winged helix-turn-helix (wHTH) protein